MASGSRCTAPTLKVFTRNAQAVRIPEGFTPHSPRHAFVSALLARNVPIADVAQWLGHRDINETYRTYGHLIPSAAARAPMPQGLGIWVSVPVSGVW